MPHNKIKNAFLSAVNSVIANPDQFAVDLKKDFTRQRKITPDILISFLVSKGCEPRRIFRTLSRCRRVRGNGLLL